MPQGKGNRVSFNPIHQAGRALRHAGNKLLNLGSIRGTWIDVGAYHGDLTIGYARHNPGLTIYAFEPNLSAAATLIGRAPNYFVLPMAVAETDGTAELNVNTFDAASSLLPFNEQALQTWIGGDALKVESKVSVPTVRLDTFMKFMKIDKVDFLKIDTQGMDLSVVRSAGKRLSDIAKITLEVDVTPTRLYSGASSKKEVVTFLKEAGFSLAASEIQNQGQEENIIFVRAGKK